MMFAVYGFFIIFFIFGLMSFCAEKAQRDTIKNRKRKKEKEEIQLLKEQVCELLAENEVLSQQAFELAVKNKSLRRERQQAQEEKNNYRKEYSAIKKDWEETLEEAEDIRADLKKHQQAVNMFLDVFNEIEDIKFFLHPEGYKAALFSIENK